MANPALTTDPSVSVPSVAEPQRKHLLSMRVMRLTRPSISAPPPLACDWSLDLAGSVFHEIVMQDPERGSPKVEDAGIGSLLMLPMTLGNTYFGETFSCYLHIQNISGEVVRDVLVSPEVVNEAKAAALLASTGLTGERRYNDKRCALLDPGQSLDHVIHHEMVEEGKHVLFCETSYTNQAGERMFYKKSYQFIVQKPLDLKTKFYNPENSELFLEAQIKNLTDHHMHMEEVRLDPSPCYDVQCYQVPSVSRSLLAPKAVFQYLFKITDKRTGGRLAPSSAGGTQVIGKINLVWRGPMGERGRLQTRQLSRNAVVASSVLRLEVVSLPSLVLLDVPFVLSLAITNASPVADMAGYRLRMSDQTESSDDASSLPAFIVIGKSNFQLPVLRPSEMGTVSVTLQASRPGFQTIQGLEVVDAEGRATKIEDEVELQVLAITASEHKEIVATGVFDQSEEEVRIVQQDLSEISIS